MIHSDENPDRLTGEQIDAIAEEFASQLRTGEPVSKAEYLERYGDDEALHEVLSGVEVLEQMKRSGSHCSPAEPEDLSALTDYTIVREIGRGGMGIVYEAIHNSLRRKVAIKVLASHRLNDTKQLVRFQTEARAAARLRHPSIVPVFGVGKLEHANSQTHYYVMDYIAGRSLSHVLQNARNSVPQDFGPQTQLANIGHDRPTIATGSIFENREEAADGSEDASHGFEVGSAMDSFDDVPTKSRFLWAANLGADIADALDYAHAQGVLHRDIKPGNLILDELGHVWLADFGLAKLAEPASVTQTGEILGTPKYMPPEALMGKYDVRSEIFALGLTLYECITLQAAYGGTSTSDAVQQASEAKFSLPSEIDARIPRDLETIVLKCLGKDPATRYSSAAEVRDDLHRFQSDLPVNARRIGPVRRLFRWARREPLVAGLTVASFALLVCLGLAASFGYWQARENLVNEKGARAQISDALDEKTAALKNASESQRLAEANLQVALRAFEEISSRISIATLESDADLLGEVVDTTAPGVTTEDAAILESLLNFYDELATTNSTQLLRESAEAAERAGAIYASLGQLAKSASSLDNASQRYDALRRNSDSNELRIAHARLLNETSAVAGLRGEFLTAIEAFRRTLKILDAIPSAQRTGTAQYERARAYRLQASIPSLGGTNSGARLPRRPILDRLGQQKQERATESAGKAIALLTQLREHSASDQIQAELARAYRTRADANHRARNRDEATQDIAESIRLWEELLEKQPTSDAIRYELASTLVRSRNVGQPLLAQARRAHDLTTQLLRKSPGLPRYQSLRAMSLQSLAQVEIRSTRIPAARRHLEEAREIYEALHLNLPEIAAYALRKTTAVEAMAELEYRSGNREQATLLLTEAIEGLKTSIDSNLSNASLLRIELQRLRRKEDRYRRTD